MKRKRLSAHLFACLAFGAGLRAAQAPSDAPLTLKIGSVYITPVGFFAVTWVTRSTNLGSGIGANIAAIPFNNVPQARLTDG